MLFLISLTAKGGLQNPDQNSYTIREMGERKKVSQQISSRSIPSARGGERKKGEEKLPGFIVI